jgi:hypothetical protein
VARWRTRAAAGRRSARERGHGFIVQVPHRVFDVRGEPFAVLHGLVDVIEEVTGVRLLDSHRLSGGG